MSLSNPVGKSLLGDAKTPGAWQRTICSNVGPLANLPSRLSETHTNRQPLSRSSLPKNLILLRERQYPLGHDSSLLERAQRSSRIGRDPVQFFFF